MCTAGRNTDLIMSAQRLLKILALVSIAMTAAAVFEWRQSGLPPPRWMLHGSLGAFGLALIVGLLGAETRPRMMLRFVAALAALVSTIAFVSDLSHAGGGFTSLIGHIRQFFPSVLAAVQASVERAAGPAMWDPVALSILSVPTFMLFALLAALCGYASRRRRKLSIYAN